jgi:hypothetical protein
VLPEGRAVYNFRRSYCSPRRSYCSSKPLINEGNLQQISFPGAPASTVIRPHYLINLNAIVLRKIRQIIYPFPQQIFSPQPTNHCMQHQRHGNLRTLPAMLGLLLFLGAMLLSTGVSATHFRGGTLNWQQNGGNSIKFTISTTWRRGFSWSGGTWPGGPNPIVGSTINIGSITYGDGGSATLFATVVSSDAASDIINTTCVITHTYSAGGKYVVNALNNCCRLSSISDANHDINFNLQALVTVGGPPFNNSPVSSLPAIINLPINAAAATFDIPGADPDGDVVTYRISRIGAPTSITDTLHESGLAVASPPGLTLSQSGTITMNTVGRTIGQLYAFQIMVEDRNSLSSPVKSKFPVDVLLRMVGPSAAPLFVTPTPAPASTFTVAPGNALSFTIAAIDTDAGQTVTLVPVSVPIGAGMSPTLPVTGAPNDTVRAAFNWTPTNAQVGTYVVTFVARDPLGIQALRSVTINVPCALSVSGNVTSVTCHDGTDGAIDITPGNFSGSSNLIYTWTGPGAFSAATQDITGVGAGLYSVRIDDTGTGCFVTQGFSIEQPSAISITPSITNPNCHSSADGAISLSVSGGTPGYTYAWSNAATTSGISGLTGGLYGVTVTDSKGCAEVRSYAVEAPAALGTATSVTNVSCNGGSNGAVDLTAFGGVAPYTFLWSNSSTNEDLGGVPAGNYSVTVTDAHNCTTSATAAVTEPAGMTIAANVTNVSCNGGSNGAIDITVSGGAGSYTYNWGGGITTEDRTGLTAGSYSVTVTDANGCSKPAAFNVSQAPALSASIPNVTTFCGLNTIYKGYGPQSLTLTVNAAGGTPGYTYLWSPGGATASSVAVSPSNSTTYTAVVTDANGCSVSKSILVKVKDVRCGNNMDKVMVCHGNNAICISPSAVPAHMSQHGDCLGDCSSAFARGTAVNHINLENGGVAIFPNPAHGKINIELKESGSAYRSYQIMDVNGRVIASAQLSGDVHADIVSVDISTFVPGVYVIRAVTDDGANLAKFTVQ